MALLVEGKARAAETARQDRAWLAWHIAALGRQKTLLSLDKLIGKKKSPTARRQPLSADVMLSFARMWSAVAGPESES